MGRTIYSNITRLIKEKNLTISKVESTCGLGNGTIAKLEKGNPTIGTLEKISGVLGCTVSDLLKEEE